MSMKLSFEDANYSIYFLMLVYRSMILMNVHFNRLIKHGSAPVT